MLYLNGPHLLRTKNRCAVWVLQDSCDTLWIVREAEEEKKSIVGGGNKTRSLQRPFAHS